MESAKAHGPADGLGLLPNELLLQILALLKTKELLPLTSVSHRFHSLAVRIIHTRLASAASLRDHAMSFECYHPSRKYHEPTLYCQHLGTDGLEESRLDEGGGSPHMASCAMLQRLTNLYSRFRPHRIISENNRGWRNPAGDVPGSRTYGPASRSQQQDESTPAAAGSSAGNAPTNVNRHDPSDSSEASGGERRGSGPCGTVFDPNMVTQLASLDSDVYFTQLVVQATVARHQPELGLLYAYVGLNREGVLRMFRHWLAERAASDIRRAHESRSDEPLEDIPDVQTDESIIWLSLEKNVGVRFRVKQLQWEREQLVVTHRDEEPAVSYELGLEEVVVRTTHLLLKTEESSSFFEQNSSATRKAMVFGNFFQAKNTPTSGFVRGSDSNG